jgi:hypothetical protein
MGRAGFLHVPSDPSGDGHAALGKDARGSGQTGGIGHVKPYNSIVILSHRWTGSSIFAGLLHRAGYWVGADTVRGPDFETYENARLVELNSQLLGSLRPECGLALGGVSGNGDGLGADTRFCADAAEEVGRRASELDLSPLREFVSECDRERFWTWKDPQLAWTVRAWAHVADFSRSAFLTLSRSELQCWITLNKRMHVQSWRCTRRYQQAINAANQSFAQTHGARHLHLTLEDLLLQPEQTLEQLNEAFGLFLGMSDLQAVCRLPLYRKRRDWRDFADAVKVYLKNYHARDGRGVLAPADTQAA